MVFSSIVFLFYFLPIVLLLNFLSPFRLKNLILLLGSWAFYAWGQFEYVGILLFSFGINYLFGRWIDLAKTSKQSLWITGLGVFCNLALLGFFKYTRLLVRLDEELGLGLGISEPHLPLGISFFTFQAITYLVDVQRKEVPVEKKPIDLALYIAMFPQVIAGPIIRYKEIAGQLRQRTITVDRFAHGVRWFIIGLSMKVLIADTLGYPAEQISSLGPEELTASVAWVGIIFYSLQIYFDFAGYSNIAIGLGLMLGFRFPENFNFPYISQSITEFWSRWHMTLSNFLKDYVYYPVAMVRIGNRKGTFRIFFNVIFVFFLCGLWHGASPHYVFFGLYHGVFFVIERFCAKCISFTFPKLIRHIYALLVLMGGWVLFWRGDPGFYYKAMVGFGEGSGSIYHVGMYLTPDAIGAFVIGVLASTPALSLLEGKLVVPAFEKRKRLGYVLPELLIGFFYVAIFLFSAANMASQTYKPFLYFNF